MWLVVHLVAAAVLTGVGVVVQLLVYPAFRLVGQVEWTGYHAHHTRMITWVVAVPWAVQGVSTVALLVDPPRPGGWQLAVALAVLAAVTVAATVGRAVPVHGRIGAAVEPGARTDDTAVLLRCNAVRVLAWAVSTAVAAGAVLVDVG